MELPVMILVGMLLWAFVFGLLGAWVAIQCGREPMEGLWLGILLGAFGVLIECLLPKFPDDLSPKPRRD